MKIKKWGKMCLADKIGTVFFTAVSGGCAAVSLVMPTMAAPAAMALAAAWVERDEDPDETAPHDWAKRYPLHDGHDGPGFD